VPDKDIRETLQPHSAARCYTGSSSGRERWGSLSAVRAEDHAVFRGGVGAGLYFVADRNEGVTPAEEVYPDPLVLSLTVIKYPYSRKGGQEMEPRRPRRRYNRNVELLLGILVIVLVVVLLVWLID